MADMSAEAYVGELYRGIECSPVQMAVVDYLGRRDADGWVTPRTELRRRFGVRSMAHVRVYRLAVVRANPAAARALALA